MAFNIQIIINKSNIIRINKLKRNFLTLNNARKGVDIIKIRPITLLTKNRG